MYSNIYIVCGKVYNKVMPLILNGGNASFGTAPWNAGVYENNEMICGGTLISENIVVSGKILYAM